MIVLHALWADAGLHLWGERCVHATVGSTEAVGESAAHPVPFAVPDDELRRITGDLWDSLLITGATSSRLILRLPHRNGKLVSSLAAGSDARDGEHSATAPREREIPPDFQAAVLSPCPIRTLAFSPTDAVDLLTTIPTFEREEIHSGASLRYWSRVAELVLELLARHRFVPAAHRNGADQYRGFWRVVVNDRATSERLGALIESMPPVCRSQITQNGGIQASTLVEDFLWTTVDALVRRCLDGDELAHAIHDRPADSLTLQMRWLQALVGSDPTLRGTGDECEAVCETVEGWLSKLEPVQQRTCRTCFRLHPPPSGSGLSPQASEESWTLSLHVQSADAPSLVVDAVSLLEDRRDHPMILHRPFDDALGQLRGDLGAAARHFPPLAACAQPDGPLECALTLEEAYQFLRDAAPVLEAEGFKVWVPTWWREDRPRLRMRLDIRPVEAEAGAGLTAMGLDALVEYDWRVALGDEDLTLEELIRLTDVQSPLAQLRGQWTEIQVSDVEAALRFVQEPRSDSVSLFEALQLSFTADDLETGLPVAGIHAHGWIDQFLSATTVNEAIEHVAQPAGFRGTLRPYQRVGLDWLRFLYRHGLGACLADDMGLGKTIQMIALWLHERESGGLSGPTLLVVPMSLVGNWQREITRFAPSLSVMVHHGLERLTGEAIVEEVAKYDVVISTYGLAHRDYEHLRQVSWHRIALDEAQNIKNSAAKQSMAVRSLRTAHRVALTGTPVENRLAELWSIIDFLNPGYLGSASEFRRRFAVPIERHHDPDRGQRLRELIRPFVLRRLKEDPNVAADLPDKLEMTVYCNLTPEQAALYEGVVQDMLGHIDQSGGIQRRGLILAAIVKLKQICNHPVQFSRTGGTLSHRSGKCDRLVEMLEEVVAEDHHALVFTQYREMGHLLQRHLQESLDREILFLHGGTTLKQRDRIVERFQTMADETPVLILTLKAGGYGLNLTAANHVFHYDRWWNPAVENQATDRTHRIGQTRQVQIHRFVCLGTLEERIAALIEGKKALADHVVGGGEDWVTELSTEQLREFLALSREAVAED
ncbi:MAG: DEAD/DEAH box helicase [Planctomycetota bacterium]|jgi:SNF2 family DNA or RNA helicase